jgi:hypothetical protein
MFGCYCLYCDGQAVGWIHDSVLSLREVLLDYLPEDIKRPSPTDKIQELLIPFDYVAAEISKGIANVALETGIPVLFGVLTTDNLEQAIERAGTKAGNKGSDAAKSAIEMVNLLSNF